MTRNRLTGLAATLLLLGILIGIPAALVAIGANPLPETLPTLEQVRAALTSPDDGTLMLRAITVIAWGAWAVMVASILTEILSRLRGVRAPHLPGITLPQRAAQQLVTTAALLFIVGSTPVTTANATVSAALSAAPVAATEPATPTAPVAVGGNPTPDPGSQHTPQRHYTVRDGDTLSAIALRQLGDADRWPEIFQASRHTSQPGGVHLVDPDRIHTGWMLTLPPSTTPPPAGNETRQTPRNYTVRDGDTLSAIALRQLGDAGRWPEIFQASRRTRQPGGVHLVDPDKIQTGWVLTIPTTVESAPATNDQPAAATGPSPALERQAAQRPIPDTDPLPAPPVTPARPTPVRTTTASTNQANPAASVDGDDQDAPMAPTWVLAGLSGSGALLAGSMLLLLRRRRRAQLRHRRPGHTMPAPAPVLAPVEKTLVGIGARTAPTVEYLDATLRRLAAACAADRRPLPEVAAVELTGTAVVLHLDRPTDPHGPWTDTQAGHTWHLDAVTSLDDIGPDIPDQPAPYPLLVTIGQSDDGKQWLLNIENQAVTITGDPTFAQDLARYLAAETACNPWSSGIHVACIGVAGEVAPLNPDRIHAYNADGAANDLVAELLAEAVHTIDRTRDAGTDTSTARAHQAGDDAWSTHLLLVDAGNDNPVLDQLLDLIDAHPGHTATSVVLRGPRAGSTGTAIHVTSEGRLTVPSLGLDLVAVGLTPDEAQGCAALLAASENFEPVPVPADSSATGGWEAFTDLAGSLRAEHVLPRDVTHDPRESASSLLTEDDDTYLDAAATTREDLQAIAPRVTSTVRADLEHADPTLDDDIAMWFHPDCALPRLYLLGPVHATTRGTPVTKRKPYLTELLAFIALRRHGATSGEVADAFNITKPKARDYVTILRDWLGTNPRTGDPHLPDARFAPAAAVRDMPVYQVLDLLTDVDLFRRLRARGQARGGQDGIADLKTALRLVEGRPFDHSVDREAGWTWLLDGGRLDEQAAVAIVDVAHTVATHELAEGDLAAAREAAGTATLAAPDEEIPRIDLAAIASAEGSAAEAQRIIGNEISNRTDDDGPPPEVGDRTGQLLQHRTQWRKHQAS